VAHLCCYRFDCHWCVLDDIQGFVHVVHNQRHSDQRRLRLGPPGAAVKRCVRFAASSGGACHRDGIVLLSFVFPDAFLSRLAIYEETLSPNSSTSELGHRHGLPIRNFLGAFDYPRWPYGYVLDDSARRQ